MTKEHLSSFVSSLTKLLLNAPLNEAALSDASANFVSSAVALTRDIIEKSTNYIAKIADACATTMHVAMILRPKASHAHLVILEALTAVADTKFPYHFIFAFLKQLTIRGVDPMGEVEAVLTSKCGVPATFVQDVLNKRSNRKAVLSSRAFVPSSMFQCSGATIQLIDLMLDFSLGNGDEWATSENIPCPSSQIGIDELVTRRKPSSKFVELCQKRLFDLLDQSQVHHHHVLTLLLTTLCIMSKRELPNARRYPLALLFDSALKSMLIDSCFDEVFPQFLIGPSPQQQLAHLQRLSVMLFEHEFITAKVCIALYFGSSVHGPAPVVDAAQQSVAHFEGVIERAARFSRELALFVKGTATQSSLDLQQHRMLSSGSANNCNSNGVPMNGELQGQRLFTVTHDGKAPAPHWGDLLSRAEEKASKWRLFPLHHVCFMVQEMQCYRSAARIIAELMHEAIGLNIFLYRGEVVQSSLSSAVINHVTERISTLDSTCSPVATKGPLGTRPQAEAECLLKFYADVLPLLQVCQGYLSNLPFVLLVARSLNRCVREVSEHDRNLAIEVVQNSVAYFMLPCFRSLPPSPVLYDQLDELFQFLEIHGGLSVGMLTAAASVPRCPRDALLFVELEATYSQCLKRMTQDNVRSFAPTLRPLMYSNPLFLAERLFVRTIGYEKDYLLMHALILENAPRAIQKMFLVLGMDLMAKYADEEREGCDNRVALIAGLLALMWRVNPKSFDGVYFLRGVNSVLCRKARSSIIFATEALKAVFYHLTHTICEFDEQYSSDQLLAFSTPYGAVAKWFARGASSSYLSQRWDPVNFSPEVLAASRKMLANAFDQPSSAGAAVSLGASLTLKLAELITTVYDLHADLSGTMNAVLVTSGKDYNTMNSLCLQIAETLQCPPPVAQLGVVALPHMTLRLGSLWCFTHRNDLDWVRQTEAQLREFGKTKERSTDLSDDCGMDEVAHYLSLLQAADLDYSPEVYSSARHEVQRLITKLDSCGSKKISGASVKSKEWCRLQSRWVDCEMESHKTQCEKSRGLFKSSWLESILAIVETNPFGLIQRCLLPRALISLEDVSFVRAFLKILLDSTSHTHSSCDPFLTARRRRCVIDLILSLVSTIMSLFIALTDGECKRCGYLLGYCIELLESEACAASNPTGRLPTDSTDLVARCHEFERKASHLCRQSGKQSYLLEVEAFLVQCFFEILTADHEDVPSFAMRHAFLILERLKGKFPRTREAAGCMIEAIKPHLDKAATCFAAATAQLKILVPIANSPNGGGGEYIAKLLENTTTSIGERRTPQVDPALLCEEPEPLVPEELQDNEHDANEVVNDELMEPSVRSQTSSRKSVCERSQERSCSADRDNQQPNSRKRDRDANESVDDPSSGEEIES